MIACRQSDRSAPRPLDRAVLSSRARDRQTGRTPCRAPVDRTPAAAADAAFRWAYTASGAKFNAAEAMTAGGRAGGTRLRARRSEIYDLRPERMQESVEPLLGKERHHVPEPDYSFARIPSANCRPVSTTSSSCSLNRPCVL